MKRTSPQAGLRRSCGSARCRPLRSTIAITRPIATPIRMPAPTASARRIRPASTLAWATARSGTCVTASMSRSFAAHASATTGWRSTRTICESLRQRIHDQQHGLFAAANRDAQLALQRALAVAPAHQHFVDEALPFRQLWGIEFALGANLFELFTLDEDLGRFRHLQRDLGPCRVRLGRQRWR